MLVVHTLPVKYGASLTVQCCLSRFGEITSHSKVVWYAFISSDLVYLLNTISGSDCLEGGAWDTPSIGAFIKSYCIFALLCVGPILVHDTLFLSVSSSWYANKACSI